MWYGIFLAAPRHGHNVLYMDNEPEFVDLAVHRIRAFQAACDAHATVLRAWHNAEHQAGEEEPMSMEDFLELEKFK